MGKGLTGSHSPQRKPRPAMQRRIHRANIPAGDSLGATIGDELRKRGCLKIPVRKYRSPGSVRGGGG
jgi:hypothetical protein